MGDGPIGVYCGGAAGRAWLRQPEEFTDYETDYAAADIVCGLAYANVAWGWGQFSLLTDVRYSYLGGSDTNRGSHRHAVSADVGLRTRLSVVVLEASAGGGYARTAFDFGKGFPVPTVDGAAVQVHVSIGLDLCWGDTLCLTPFVEFTHEWGVAGEHYELPMLLGGLRFGARPSEQPTQGGPQSGEVSPERSPQRSEYSTNPRRSPLRTPAEARVSHRLLPPEPTPSAPSGPPQTLVQRLFLKDTILFTNDYPTVNLSPQQFAQLRTAPRLPHANPDLDAYIRAIVRWGIAVKNRPTGLDGHLTFVLRVFGYANDTGDPARNQLLADARSANVVAYLSRSNGTYDVDAAKHVTRVTLAPLIADGTVRIIDENHRRPRPPVQALRDDFGSDVVVTNPIFRMARLVLDVVLDGQVVSTKQALEIITTLERLQ